MPLLIPPFIFPDHGVLSVFTQSNDGSHEWRNTIDVVWLDSDGPPGPGEPVILAFVEFLQGFMRDDCTIVKYSLQPYSKGNLPFDQQGNIWETTADLPCKNWGPGTVYPLAVSSGTTPLGETCVSVIKPKFGTGPGKPGRLFVRNGIDNANVTSTAGGPPVLTTLTAGVIPGDINAWATTKLGSFCEDNPLPRFCLVHAAHVSPDEFTVFDSAMAVPKFERLTTHDITKKHKK